MEIDDRIASIIKGAIVDLLTGVPIGQACHILNETQALILDMHTVDPECDRFKEKLSELQAHGASNG